MGNITVGRDVRLAQMKNHYDALLFAYGAAKDRLLGIPGERELKGIYSAREFVGWYNGLPEFARLSPNLDTDHAVVIGNGNVALDVARILLTDVDSLRKTDISDYALDALSKSRVNRVTIAGRRGPMQVRSTKHILIEAATKSRQAAFTIKELRELVDLPGTAFRSDNIELIPSAEWIAKLPRLEQRRYRFAKLLTAGASAADRHCHLRSLLSPQAFIDDRKDGVLSQVTFRYNKFKDDTQRFNSTAQVEPTERLETLDAGLAFRSIGYKAVSIPGLREELGVDFSERSGTILNDGFGRALQRRGDVNGSPVQALPGCYCTGWVKNGPTGVIATTMGDAFSSADSVVEDWASGLPFLNGSSCGRNPSLARGWSGLQAQVGLSNLPTHVSWSEWRAIDELEKQLGREQGGKPRAKLRDVEQMMTAAHHSHADQSTQR